MNGRPPRILIVDDNPSDVEIMEIVLREAGLPVALEVCEDGEKASRRFAAPPPGSSWPDLVLLDFRLPKRNGREVLGDIRANPAARAIPVIVLTSAASQEEMDAFRSFENTTCLLKPYLLKEYPAVVAAIRQALAGGA